MDTNRCAELFLTLQLFQDHFKNFPTEFTVELFDQEMEGKYGSEFGGKLIIALLSSFEHPSKKAINELNFSYLLRRTLDRFNSFKTNPIICSFVQIVDPASCDVHPFYALERQVRLDIFCTFTTLAVSENPSIKALIDSTMVSSTDRPNHAELKPIIAGKTSIWHTGGRSPRVYAEGPTGKWRVITSTIDELKDYIRTIDDEAPRQYFTKVLAKARKDLALRAAIKKEREIKEEAERVVKEKADLREETRRIESERLILEGPRRSGRAQVYSNSYFNEEAEEGEEYFDEEGNIAVDETNLQKKRIANESKVIKVGWRRSERKNTVLQEINQ